MPASPSAHVSKPPPPPSQSLVLQHSHQFITARSPWRRKKLKNPDAAARPYATLQPLLPTQAENTSASKVEGSLHSRHSSAAQSLPRRAVGRSREGKDKPKTLPGLTKQLLCGMRRMERWEKPRRTPYSVDSSQCQIAALSIACEGAHGSLPGVAAPDSLLRKPFVDKKPAGTTQDHTSVGNNPWPASKPGTGAGVRVAAEAVHRLLPRS